MPKRLVVTDLDQIVDPKSAEIILHNYVVPVMKDILLKHIQDDIYGQEAPTKHQWFGGQPYSRTGALLEESSLYDIMLDDTTVMVTSNAQPDYAPIKTSKRFDGNTEGGFLAMLENGNMGFWSTVTGLRFPRPAISNAQKEIDDSPEIEAALQRGLKEVLGLT